MAYLKRVTFNWTNVDERQVYPFNIPALANTESIDVNHNVVFIVGENGSGKSTLLEAIAYKSGFNIGGGAKHHDLGVADDSKKLASAITLSWMPKANNGFFLRSETFFNFANYLDEMAQDPYSGGAIVYDAYGGKSLNKQSHGEAFLSLFNHRFGSKSLYILDEPEAALSPQRQLAFLSIVHDLEQRGSAQFIIATHSPILMAYPGARIYLCDEGGLQQIDYEETEHYRLTRAFLDNRERFFRELFAE